MERLTKLKNGRITYNEKRDPVFECGEFCDNCPTGTAYCRTMKKMIRKLAAYEDLEEQGLLVRLPCKVGDMVWDNDFGYPESYEIKAFSYGYCDSYVEPDIEDQIIFYYENYIGSITGAFPMSEIGKTVFLTREEAEKKLEEMKKDE
jgi:hypothetical protein